MNRGKLSTVVMFMLYGSMVTSGLMNLRTSGVVGHGGRALELPQRVSSGVHFTKASLVWLIEQSIHVGQFDLVVIVE